MKPAPKHWFVVVVAAALVASTGCYSTFYRDKIGSRYQERTTVHHSWEPASSSTSIWGRAEGGSWKELWPNIPNVRTGNVWLLRGEDLLFVGYAEGRGGKRVVLLSRAGEPARDLSAEIFAAAVAAGLIEKRLADGSKYVFDGLEANDHDIFVNLNPGEGALFTDPDPADKLPIPLELLKRP